MSAPPSFRRRFLATVLASTYEVQKDNWADYRFGPFNGKLDLGTQVSWLDWIVEQADAFAETEARLEDEESRALLMKLLTYRALGHLRVRLPRNTSEYRRKVARIDTDPEGAHVLERIPGGPRGGSYVFDLPEEGIRLMGRQGTLINLIYNRQYDFHRGPVRIRVEPGDFIIDGGAASGDTAVFFAARAGEKGRVFAYEFEAENLERYTWNMTLNPGPAARVELVKRAIGESTGQVLRYDPRGHGTRVGETGSAEVMVLSVDDLVAERNLDRLDFIKLDVEGSEPGALRGAAGTIARFRPRLAISAYHRPDDLFALPRLIDGLAPGYAFFLDHHSIHAEETVLYGLPRERMPA